MAVYNRKDFYYKKAKKEGYKSRAAYKLLELNSRFSVVKKGFRVLDCGAAPGGWSQVALELAGPAGLVVGTDLNPADLGGARNYRFIRGDFTSEETVAAILAVCPRYDAVISDIAPHTTGIRDADHSASLSLVESVYAVAIEVLKPGGSFLFKLFEGSGRKELTDRISLKFRSVKIAKPDATRGGSVEIYVAASGFLGAGGD